MFQMNPLAAVGALAAFVTHVVLGEELPSTARALPPHLGGASTRHELYHFQSPRRHLSALSRVDLGVEEKLLEIRIVAGVALNVEPSP